MTIFHGVCSLVLMLFLFVTVHHRLINGNRYRRASCQTNMHVSNDDLTRLSQLKQLLNLLEKRADNLERKFGVICEEKPFARKAPIKRRPRFATYLWTHKFGNSTTIHGLREVLTETHPVLRVLWVILFCSFLALCGYHLAQVSYEYEKRSTISKISILRQPKYEFPPMFVCPDAWLDANKVNLSGLSRRGMQLALAYLINYGIEPPPYVIEDRKQAELEFDAWYEKSNFSNLGEFFQYVTVDSEQVVSWCTFCNGSHKFTKRVMDGTVCYGLPVPPIEGSSSLGDLDFVQFRVQDRSAGLLLRRSYWKMIVNPDLSLGISNKYFLHIYPGYSNTIRIRPRKFTTLISRQCLSNEEIKRRGGYSQASCMAACMFASPLLNCTPINLYPTAKIPRNHANFCHSYPEDYWSERENGSIMAATNDSDKPTMLQVPPECFRKCRPVCEKLVYESSVEAHPMIVNGSRNKEETELLLLNEVVQYFGVLSFEEVEPYSLETLISNVGGMLALWLGASVVSLIQLPVLVCAAVRKQWVQRGKHKPTNSANL